MEKLEKAYAASEKYFSTQSDWSTFADRLKPIFACDLTIYCIAPPTTPKSLPRPEIISSTQQPIFQEYLDLGLYLKVVVPENDLGHFAPVTSQDFRDAYGDEIVDSSDIAKFYESNNIYHFLMIPAFLDCGTFLGAFSCRSREEAQFSHQEIRRMTLWLRYISFHLDRFGQPSKTSSNSLAALAKSYGLTDKEAAVLAHLIKGRSLKEIADLQKISYGTVRWHVQNILYKSDVSSQKELLAKFYAALVPETA